MNPPRAAARTLAFVLTTDWFFASHFLDRALAARRAGWRVALIARTGAATAGLRAQGIEVIDLPIGRASLNPLTEARAVVALWRIYGRVRPDLLHHVALKPVVYGSLAARLAGIRHVVNAPIGMGFVFSSPGRLARLLRPLAVLALRLTLAPRGSVVVFENPDDRAEMIAAGLVAEAAAVLIRGAGVDTARFHPTPEPPEPVRVLLPARLVPEKGVHEFVAAARILRARGVAAEFLLAGAPDSDSRRTIAEADLRAWSEEGAVQWLGPVEDMAGLLSEVHIVCLPSYREGLPKALLEALAAGRPVVATDVPGCREAVHHGVNGLLVPPRDAEALAEALTRLIGDGPLRAAFGAAGRSRAETEFATAIVCRDTLALYEAMLPRVEPVLPVPA